MHSYKSVGHLFCWAGHNQRHLSVQGGTGANVLVGIQVPDEEMKEFQNQAKNLGYEYAHEMKNEAYRLLMQ